jgi:hypothetical protein
MEENSALLKLRAERWGAAPSGICIDLRTGKKAPTQSKKKLRAFSRRMNKWMRENGITREMINAAKAKRKRK